MTEIVRQIPDQFLEYREPFVGGGAVFLYLRQKFPHLSFWINDLNFDLYCFWTQVQKDAKRLAAAISDVKSRQLDGRALFEKLRDQRTRGMTDFDRAVRFFILNRISFSGTVDSGGYSEGAFHRRFTESSIERLAKLGPLLDEVRITNEDYANVVQSPGCDVFIYLDPPYLVAAKSRLYGVNGALHTTFDHIRFAREMWRCPHLWLITYDDSPEIRRNFDFAYQHGWQLQYGMNNFKQPIAAKGNELFITNYPLPQRRVKQLKLFERRPRYALNRGR